MAWPAGTFGSALTPNRGPESVDDGVTLRLCGSPGSPYTNKVLFYLRYRRIPHRFVLAGGPETRGTADPPGPPLLPKLLWPDGAAQNDSTFLLRSLEARCLAGRRTAVPPDPGQAFLAYLLEDFADEWLTKAMYHYRWTLDHSTAGEGIALQHALGPDAATEAVERVAAAVRARQVDRLAIVGSNPDTAPVIERFYVEFLDKLEKHLAAGHRFLLGNRPAGCDFAVLGQLHPMIALDRRTSDLTRARAPRVCAWYNTAIDLSGLSVVDEGAGWASTESPVPPTLAAILRDVGRFYTPFLLANDAHFRRGDKTFACRLDGGRVEWRQPTFKYQSKCLGWIREEFGRLDAASRKWVLAQLEPAGCAPLVSHNSAKL